MIQRLFIPFLFVIAPLALGRGVWAAEDSVDTAVFASEIILRGEVTSIDPQNTFWCRIDLDVLEVVKGTAAGHVHFYAQDSNILPGLGIRPREFWYSSRPQCICFLVRTQGPKPWRVFTPDPDDASGYLIARPGNFASARLLEEDAPWPSIRGDLAVLMGCAAVFDRARQLVAAGTPPPAESIALLHPVYGLRLYARDWDVTVPLTAELRKRSLDWAKSPSPVMRVNAARVLATQRCPAHSQILQSMLVDPALIPDGNRGRMHDREYPVRIAAYNGLARWGEAAHRPVLHEPDDLHVALTAKRLSIAVLILAFSALLWIVWRARGEPDEVSPRHKRRAIGRAGFVAAALVLLLWTRSQWAVYQLEFELKSWRIEVTGAPTGLRFAWIEGWPNRTPAAISGMPAGTDLDQVWQLPSTDSRAIRVRNSTWMTRGNGVFADFYTPALGTSRWKFVMFPYWVVLLAALSWPALLAGAARIHRARCRKRRRCVHCGYDLRSSQRGCPECGTSLPKPRRRWRQVVLEQERADRAARRIHDQGVAQLAEQLDHVSFDIDPPSPSDSAVQP
jgi:hypothetical protein